MSLSHRLQWEHTQRRMEKDPHDIACEKPCELHNIPRARVRETERERERKRGAVFHWNSCNMTGSMLLERESMAQKESY